MEFTSTTSADIMLRENRAQMNDSNWYVVVLRKMDVVVADRRHGVGNAKRNSMEINKLCRLFSYFIVHCSLSLYLSYEILVPFQF